MSIFTILDKKKLSGVDCFNLFNDYSKVACITDFAIASGTIPFVNEDNLRSGKYWVNDSNELNNNYAFVVSEDDKYECLEKTNKYYIGIRVAGKYSEVKKFITDETRISRDLFVGKMGYFPNKVYMDKINFKKLINTGIYFNYNCQKRSSFDTFYLSQEEVYQSNDDYIVKCECQSSLAHLSDDQIYSIYTDAVFKLEPIRIWIDKEHDLILTQDIILGGVAYSSKLGDKEYDDYDESDVARLLEIFEHNIENSMALYDRSKVKKKRYM